MTDKSVDLEVILFFSWSLVCYGCLWLSVMGAAVMGAAVMGGASVMGGAVSRIVLRTFRFAPSLPHLRCGSLPLTAAGGHGPLGQHRLRPCTHPFLPSTALQPWLPAYGHGTNTSFPRLEPKSSTQEAGFLRPYDEAPSSVMSDD